MMSAIPMGVGVLVMHIVEVPVTLVLLSVAASAGTAQLHDLQAEFSQRRPRLGGYGRLGPEH